MGLQIIFCTAEKKKNLKSLSDPFHNKPPDSKRWGLQLPAVVTQLLLPTGKHNPRLVRIFSPRDEAKPCHNRSVGTPSGPEAPSIAHCFGVDVRGLAAKPVSCPPTASATSLEVPRATAHPAAGGSPSAQPLASSTILSPWQLHGHLPASPGCRGVLLPTQPCSSL